MRGLFGADGELAVLAHVPLGVGLDQVVHLLFVLVPVDQQHADGLVVLLAHLDARVHHLALLLHALLVAVVRHVVVVVRLHLQDLVHLPQILVREVQERAVRVLGNHLQLGVSELSVLADPFLGHVQGCDRVVCFVFESALGVAHVPFHVCYFRLVNLPQIVDFGCVEHVQDEQPLVFCFFQWILK